MSFAASRKRKYRQIAYPRAGRGFIPPRKVYARAGPIGNRISRIRYTPGFTRVGGYYGRYAGAGAELKFFDTTTSFQVDATGEVPATGQLCLIPQGITESTRIGRKCVIKSISMKGIMVAVPGAAATSASTVWMYLIMDKQTNGAAAAATDVFTSTNFSASFRNMANSSRFKILKHWVVPFNPGAGVTTAWNNTVRSYQYYKACNIPIEFSSTTGAITEIKSNNLFLLAGTDGQSDDIVSVAGAVRVRFSDN